jgi:hypothetical protein
MIFYKAEKAVAGLIEQMQANSSIAYTTKLEEWIPGSDEVNQGKAWARDMMGDSKASISDDDLFYTKSILVSTNWNKNDDVFDRAEVWAARHTPAHKPTNIEHDEKRLVGHITDVWAIDDKGAVISDNIPVDDLPNLYHLVNGAVVYANWQDESLTQRTQLLIGEIQSGKKFVSMEALFSNFGYAVVTPGNQFRVIARNEETAFLTKHLRAYGAKGEFEGCKLGRLLRNITFSGKGYVDNPANDRSIIFNSAQVFDFGKASTENSFGEESGVSYSYADNHNSLNNKGQNMADSTSNSDLLQKQNEKLEKTVSDLQFKNDELQALANEAGVKSLEDSIASLEAELAQAKKDYDEEKKKKEDAEKAKSELQTKLDETLEAKELAESKIAEAEADKTKADRIATLVSGGMDKEAAEAKVELFSEFSDDQFQAVASELIAAIKIQQINNQSTPGEGDGSTEGSSEDESDDSEDDISKDSAEASADDSVLDNTESSDDVNMTTEASIEEDKTKNTRNELRLALASYLTHTGASYVESQDNADDSNK